MSIDPLFDKLLERGGSDLHLTPGYPPMMRIRGSLVPEGTRQLTSDGFDVLGAASAREVLELAERAGPDLVLVESALPHSSGLEICRRLSA